MQIEVDADIIIPAVGIIIEKYRPRLLKRAEKAEAFDSAPFWLVVTAGAIYGATFSEVDPETIFSKVENDSSLQDAVVGAYRLSTGFGMILDLIQKWG